MFPSKRKIWIEFVYEYFRGYSSVLNRLPSHFRWSDFFFDSKSFLIDLLPMAYHMQLDGHHRKHSRICIWHANSRGIVRASPGCIISFFISVCNIALVPLFSKIISTGSKSLTSCRLQEKYIIRKSSKNWIRWSNFPEEVLSNPQQKYMWQYSYS